MSSRPKDSGKIHLQLSEVAFIYKALYRYLSTKVKTRLQTLGIKDLKLKNKVEQNILDKFLHRLFNSLKYSIIIDGLPEDELDKTDIIDLIKKNKNKNKKEKEKEKEKIEPYDFALNDKLRNIYLKMEDSIQDISKLRKEKPQELVDKYIQDSNKNYDLIDKKVREATEVTKSNVRELNALLNEDEESIVEDFPESEWCNKKLKSILSDLSLLKREVPQTKTSFDNLIAVVNFLDDKT